MVGRNVVLKNVPRLAFVPDPSPERGVRVLQVLDEIERPPPARPGLTWRPFIPSFPPRFAAFLAQLRGQQVAVVGHARPDGDCIGSQVALARVLRARGHEVVCLNPDPVPRRLQFLLNDVVFLRPDALRGGGIGPRCSSTARTTTARASR